jgi:phosphatidylserine synthase
MAYYQAAPPPAAADPNRTLTIVGFVLAFLCSLAGLIISIISYNRSKAVGYKNNLALAGIIVSIVVIVFGIIARFAGLTSGMYGR